MRRPSLRDELFLLAHDDSGRLLGSEVSLGVGLAGATLIDLLLSGRVVVANGRLEVADPHPSGDADIDATVEAIAASTEPCGPRAWVSWISDGAYERVAEHLTGTGLVRRDSSRRLGMMVVHRFIPANVEDLVRVRARLRYAISGAEPPDPATAALAGLVRVLRLESALLLTMPTADLLLALERMTEINDLRIRLVINAVETVITTAAYR